MLRYGYSFKETAGYGQHTRFIVYRAGAVLIGLLGMAVTQSGALFMLGILGYMVFLLAEFIFKGKSSEELLRDRALGYLEIAKEKYGHSDFRSALKFIGMAERHIVLPNEFIVIKDEIENRISDDKALLCA